ncbi:serine hydrolase-like protein 2 isoform X2 [Dendrobates tinctorius]|uniref:serine hydrolase-like protein 2 isoform X2 n=1 Tax=Dendrobates tinctorius TaxID=92724 RepID=UPI003CCA0427
MTFLLKELRFKVPWGHLAAKAWGPSEGRPILCLHGWLDNANTFDRLIPLLPNEYYYVALDFSGHGLSSHMPKGVRYQHMDYVTDVHRVVTSLGWQKFSIMAHSMGGVVGGMTRQGLCKRDMAFNLNSSQFCIEKVKRCSFPSELCHAPKQWFTPTYQELILNHLKKAITHYFRIEQANGTKVYSPESALQRLLDGNPSLNSDTAKVLLQRGTKPAPGGVVFSRDIRITVNNSAPLSVEECLHIMKSIQSDVHIILANEGISADLMRGVYTDVGQTLLRGFKENLKERFQSTIVDGNHFVHLNEPEKIAKILVNQLYDRPYIHSQL